MSNDYHSHKRYLILNMISHLGPISRTELIALTDYRPASVGAIIKEMLQEGLIVETGLSSSGHGRKRVLLEINHNHLCAVAIAITAQSVSYIVAQINGVILHRITSEIDSALSKNALAAQILDQTQQLLRQFNEKNIVGIGICNPLYDPTRYQIDSSLLAGYAHFNDWIQLDLIPKLEGAADMPVSSFSAVTLPALVEQRFGVASYAQNFICVELSNGIGASICCNGRPVAGASGVAGELGHTVIDFSQPDSRLCYCGKPGCVENSTAYPALAADIRAALDRGVFSVLNSYHDRSVGLSVHDIRRALDDGDQMCMHFVKRAAVRLGVAIANLVNLLNPEMVVLYGFMLELGDFFLKQLETSIRENVLVLSKDFEIRVSDSLESKLPLGVAAELFSNYLKIEDHKWVYQIQPGDLEEKLNADGAEASSEDTEEA